MIRKILNINDYMLLMYCSQLFMVLEKHPIFLFLFHDYRSIIYISVAVKRNFSSSEWTSSCKDNVIAFFLLSQLTILILYIPSFPSIVHFISLSSKLPSPKFSSCTVVPLVITDRNAQKAAQEPSGTRIIFILVTAFLLPLPPTLFSLFHCKVFGTGTVCY